MRLFILIVVIALQGPAYAFNPAATAIKLPFSVAKFAVKTTGKVALMPVKLAMHHSKPKVKNKAAGNIASFIIKHAPYKDLALMAL